MKQIALLILLLLQVQYVFSQKYDEEYRKSFLTGIGCETMSLSGKDSMFIYLIEKNKVFDLILNRDSKPILETKNINHEFFKNKLSISDLEILDLYWDKKYNEFKKQTSLRAESYRESVNCMDSLVLSMESKYQKNLLDHVKRISNLLTNNERTKLRKTCDKKLKKLDKRKKRFVETEKLLTGELTSYIHNYWDYSFSLIAKYPSSRFLNIGVELDGELDFIYNYNIEDFLTTYIQFEEELTNGLIENNCLASLAVPRYDNSVDTKNGISRIKKNAILFLGLNLEKHENSTVNVSKHKIEIDTSKIRDSRLNIKNLINYQLISQNKLRQMDFGEPNSISLIEDSKPTSWDFLLNYQLLVSKKEKFEVLNKINEIEGIVKIKFNNSDIYYFKEIEHIGESKIETTTSIIVKNREIIVMVIIKNDDRTNEQEIINYSKFVIW